MNSLNLENQENLQLNLLNEENSFLGKKTSRNNDFSDDNLSILKSDGDIGIETYNVGRWHPNEHYRFIRGCILHGNNWKKVKDCVKTRSSAQIRSHAQKYIIKLCKKFHIKDKNNFKHFKIIQKGLEKNNLEFFKYIEQNPGEKISNVEMEKLEGIILSIFKSKDITFTKLEGSPIMSGDDFSNIDMQEIMNENNNNNDDTDCKNKKTKVFETIKMKKKNRKYDKLNRNTIPADQGLAANLDLNVFDQLSLLYNNFNPNLTAANHQYPQMPLNFTQTGADPSNPTDLLFLNEFVKFLNFSKPNDNSMMNFPHGLSNGQQPNMFGNMNNPFDNINEGNKCDPINSNLINNNYQGVQNNSNNFPNSNSEDFSMFLNCLSQNQGFNGINNMANLGNINLGGMNLAGIQNSSFPNFNGMNFENNRNNGTNPNSFNNNNENGKNLIDLNGLSPFFDDNLCGIGGLLNNGSLFKKPDDDDKPNDFPVKTHEKTISLSESNLLFNDNMLFNNFFSMLPPDCIKVNDGVGAQNINSLPDLNGFIGNEGLYNNSANLNICNLASTINCPGIDSKNNQ